MGGKREIRVSVICAWPEGFEQKDLVVPRGTSVAEAVALSGIDSQPAAVGVFGEVADSHQLVEDGDRIEVYRPLVADPKEVRRRLAREGKTIGGGKSPEERDD